MSLNTNYEEDGEGLCKYGMFDVEQDYKRMRVPNRNWALCDVNVNYALSETYPKLIYVAVEVSFEHLVASSQLRSDCLPILTYLHENKASINRCSECTEKPVSNADDIMLKSIKNTNGKSFIYVVSESGISYEHLKSDVIVKSMGIDSTSSCFNQIKSILDISDFVVDSIKNGISIVVECVNGLDRSAQVCSVSTLLLDPFYRTMVGFVTLINKEWLRFGYEVRNRRYQMSLSLTQFLYCASQMLHKYSFEFNEAFLRMLRCHVKSCSEKGVSHLMWLEGLHRKITDNWNEFLSHKNIVMNPLPKVPQGGSRKKKIVIIDNIIIESPNETIAGSDESHHIDKLLGGNEKNILLKSKTSTDNQRRMGSIYNLDHIFNSVNELLEDRTGSKIEDVKGYLVSDNNDFDIPSTQELIQRALPKFKAEGNSMANVSKVAGNVKMPTDENDDDGFVVLVDPKDLIQNIPQGPTSKRTKAIHRPRGQWIDSTLFYNMSDEIFTDIFDKDLQRIDYPTFLYRKDSIAKEIDLLFPGCVIYVERPYEAKGFWRLQAYCSHLQCRNYRLIAKYDHPQRFQIFFDNLNVLHTMPVTRQVRRYERDQLKEITKKHLPNTFRMDTINEVPDEVVQSGSYSEVKSLTVLQKIRAESLKQQDNESDDIADVEAMQTKDEATNFISKILCRRNFAVYIHSNNQHMVLHKLHQKRSKDGIQIVARVDATGGIAKEINDATGGKAKEIKDATRGKAKEIKEATGGKAKEIKDDDSKLLYYALTINVKILQDKNSTAMPLTEQFNIRHKAKDISSWLFDFVLEHNSFYENPPLLLDFVVSDFSYANFHAIQMAFNGKTLQQYLSKCYEWIIYKIEKGEFPTEYNEIVKIDMCYTHIMHTYGDITKRHYGKTASKAQVPESRVILEILGAMVKATEYHVILNLFQQMSILLSNKYKNDEVENAVVRIKEITTPIDQDLDLDSEDNLHIPIDLDELTEKNSTLYQKSPFYLEFKNIVDNTEHYFENDNVENSFYNPVFLEKFIKRFVPLIPLWSSLLNTDIIEPVPSSISLLQVHHNQPIETYFGRFKMTMQQKAVTLGKPPIKIGRAITLSRTITDSTVKSINLLIPKSGLNTQIPRKPKTLKNDKNGENYLIPLADVNKNARSVPDAYNNVNSVPDANYDPNTVAENSSSVADGNIDPVNNDESDGVSFRTAKEEYKKRAKSNFSYFQMRTVSKMAEKTISKRENLLIRTNSIDNFGTSSIEERAEASTKNASQKRHQENRVPSSVTNDVPCLVRTPHINDFAIVSVPALKGPSRNYVGQIVDVYDDGRNGFEISFLKKSYGKFIFPETLDISCVQLTDIVKILDVPIMNKRSQFTFKELTDSEIKIF